MSTFKPPAAARAPLAHPAAAVSLGKPGGTFAPGTKVQVGRHRVMIEKYLSEGGFAHVYVVRLPKPVDGVESAVLKRVAVPDKENLSNMRTEVETMKRLKGHRHIVRYIDSHASQLKGGGYEVFLLMEYCSGGGLIDFMNTRLRDRLREPEILKIFRDVAEGVACMHYLRPPLLHRDLKVENVLISGSGSLTTYKLCDFGSAASPRPAASSAAEGRLIEDDVQRHTTLQYRSPEMIDVYRKQPIDEKSDIWALGVFLYKLCYYTTPFEDVGQMAILNASFKFPAYPPFSDKLKLLVANMLRENPATRPNIYQVLQQACTMQGKPIPVTDIYTGRSQSENRKKQQMPSSFESKSSALGAMLSSSSETMPIPVPDIVPMRRGRPTRPVSHHGSTQPSPSPLRMVNQKDDPFASLDESKPNAGDELSSRFPTLDQFSILAEKGNFDFETPPGSKPEAQKPDLSQRVLNALADDAFAQPTPQDHPPPTKSAPPVANPSSRIIMGRKKSYESRELLSPLDGQAVSAEQKTVGSAETMSSPPLLSGFREKPIHRFPVVDHEKRTADLPGAPKGHRPLSGTSKPGSRLSSLLTQDAARSQAAILAEPKSPSSSRPSLEGARPLIMDSDINVSRSRSTSSKARPASASTMPKLESYGGNRLSKTSMEDAGQSPGVDILPLKSVESDITITSDVEFLRAKEGEVKSWKGGKRHSDGSTHQKRGSRSSLSLSGTKNILSGKFGDAFRRFEAGNNLRHGRSQSPSPSRAPISNLEATNLSEEPSEFDGDDAMSPEMRREVERRRLSAEEKRVADGAAEYRERLARKNGELGRDSARAVSIQNKVQSLLKENHDPTSGVGPFTDSSASQAKQFETPQNIPATQSYKVVSSPQASAPPPRRRDLPPQEARSSLTSPSEYPPSNTSQPLFAKPTAPPKPFKMRTGAGDTAMPPRPTAPTTFPATAGVFDAVAAVTTASAVDGSATVSPSDDWKGSFSKRYPSLSGLEMVETEISRPEVATVRTKEV